MVVESAEKVRLMADKPILAVEKSRWSLDIIAFVEVGSRNNRCDKNCKKEAYENRTGFPKFKFHVNQYPTLSSLNELMNHMNQRIYVFVVSKCNKLYGVKRRKFELLQNWRQFFWKKFSLWKILETYRQLL